jgi:hypothetical protein
VAVECTASPADEITRVTQPENALRAARGQTCGMVLQGQIPVRLFPLTLRVLNLLTPPWPSLTSTGSPSQNLGRKQRASNQSSTCTCLILSAPAWVLFRTQLLERKYNPKSCALSNAIGAIDMRGGVRKGPGHIPLCPYSSGTESETRRHARKVQNRQ